MTRKELVFDDKILGLPIFWFVLSLLLTGIFVGAIVTKALEQQYIAQTSYENGFAEGKIAGVFEDIKNAEKYIEENCIN
jgi:hypothetical protein